MEQKKKQKKIMSVLNARNLRDLVRQVNENNQKYEPIMKEDIVSVVKEEGQYFLIYFSEDE